MFHILEKRGIQVVIANPKWVKAVKGNKMCIRDRRRETSVKDSGRMPYSLARAM